MAKLKDGAKKPTVIAYMTRDELYEQEKTAPNFGQFLLKCTCTYKKKREESLRVKFKLHFLISAHLPTCVWHVC